MAAAALDAGAVAINDISGARDPELFDLVADRAAGLVLMHIEGPPRQDRPLPRFEDPIDHLQDLVQASGSTRRPAAASIPEQIVIDPGIDFDIGVSDGLEMLRRLEELRELGRPLYV